MNCPRNCDYQLPYYEATSTDNFVRPIAPFLPSFLSVCMHVQVHISFNYLSSIYSRLQWTHLMQTFSLASDLFLLSFIMLSILSYIPPICIIYSRAQDLLANGPVKQKLCPLASSSTSIMLNQSRPLITTTTTIIIIIILKS